MKIFTALLSLLCMNACSSSTGPAPSDTPRAPEPPASKREPAPPPESGSKMVGVLHYDPQADGVKSVEAYLGMAFTLQTEGGRKEILAASNQVSEERLRELSGQRVEVACTMEASAPPGPDESFPTDGDGKPLKRPDRCRVSAIAVIR